MKAIFLFLSLLGFCFAQEPVAPALKTAEPIVYIDHIAYFGPVTGKATANNTVVNNDDVRELVNTLENLTRYFETMSKRIEQLYQDPQEKKEAEALRLSLSAHFNAVLSKWRKMEERKP